MDQKTELRYLAVELSQEQKDEIGLRLADLTIDIEGKIETKKALPKQIEALQETAAVLGHQLKSGAEMKDIECYWATDDPEEGKKQLYRTDTAEAVGDPVDMGLFDQEEGQVEMTLPENPETENAE